jgi:hypothetical protein
MVFNLLTLWECCYHVVRNPSMVTIFMMLESLLVMTLGESRNILWSNPGCWSPKWLTPALLLVIRIRIDTTCNTKPLFVVKQSLMKSIFILYCCRAFILPLTALEFGSCYVEIRDGYFWKHATHGCPRKSVLMEFPAQTHPEPTPYCSSTQAHPNPVGSSSTISTWHSRRYYLQSCFCQDLSAHPGPPKPTHKILSSPKTHP